MKKKLLNEADIRASFSGYDDKIDTHKNYEKARDFIEKYENKEALKTIKGNFKNITKNNFDDPDDVKFNLSILLYNAGLKDKTAKVKKEGGTFDEKSTKIPEKARDLVKEAGFEIPEPNSKIQEEYTKYFNEVAYPTYAKRAGIETEQRREASSKPEEAEEEQENEPEEYEDEPEEDSEEQEEDFKYAASNPNKIAEKIKQMKDEAISNFENKIISAKKEEHKKLYRNAIAELQKISVLENKAIKQQAGFSVHPTETSKQRAMTNAQIYFNNAKTMINSVNNKYASKEIGSMASLRWKSAKEALKNTYEKAKQAVEKPSVAKDVGERVSAKVTETVPKVANAAKTKAEQLSKTIQSKIQQNAQPRPQPEPKVAQQPELDLGLPDQVKTPAVSYPAAKPVGQLQKTTEAMKKWFKR